MLRIDAYVNHLLRHGATGLTLQSNRPARFSFPTGERLTSSRLDHKQLVQLVQEAASTDDIQKLKRFGKASFSHVSDEVDVVVDVVIGGEHEWTVGLRLEGGAEEPAIKKPTLDPPMPRIPQARGSIAPPRVESKPSEPRINVLLREMVQLGASDLHLSTDVEPMVRLNGSMTVLEGHPPFNAGDLDQLLLQILPQKNRDEYANQWDTDFGYSIAKLARFRANYFRDRKGPGAVFRQIPYELLSVEQLGLAPKVLDLCWLSKGLVLVTGPTGSGKSTTLATLVDYINQNRADHIITIEDPVEFVHENKKCLVNQREVGSHTRSFKRALRAALREDPDIVLVGEMRDLETIAIAIETAETGHLVFGTLHTTSATSTVDRLIDQFPGDQQSQIRTMLASSLRGVIAQVLCKKRGGGRIAAYEILMTTPAVSNLIREGKTYQIASIMQTGRSLGMQTMNDQLLGLVSRGIVDAEEAYMKSNDKLAFREALAKAGVPLSI